MQPYRVAHKKPDKEHLELAASGVEGLHRHGVAAA